MWCEWRVRSDSQIGRRRMQRPCGRDTETTIGKSSLQRPTGWQMIKLSEFHDLWLTSLNSEISEICDQSEMKNSEWFNTSIPVRFSKVTHACEQGPDLGCAWLWSQNIEAKASCIPTANSRASWFYDFLWQFKGRDLRLESLPVCIDLGNPT